jgi:hypothetical protein
MLLHLELTHATQHIQDDNITNHKYLEQYIATLKQAGANVHSFIFGPKSGHVAHMYHHPETYLHQLDTFLARVLKQ